MAEMGFVVRFMLHMKFNHATAKHGSTKIRKSIMHSIVHRAICGIVNSQFTCSHICKRCSISDVCQVLKIK